jgi:hypothetical protein
VGVGCAEHEAGCWRPDLGRKGSGLEEVGDLDEVTDLEVGEREALLAGGICDGERGAVRLDGAGEEEFCFAGQVHLAELVEAVAGAEFDDLVHQREGAAIGGDADIHGVEEVGDA